MSVAYKKAVQELALRSETATIKLSLIKALIPVAG